jgi:methylmalonyl-CoA mutase
VPQCAEEQADHFRADWQAAASKEVKGKDIVWHTPEGIEVKPLYTGRGRRGDRSRPARLRAVIRAGPMPRCTPAGRGRSANMRASRPPRIRTPSTAQPRRRAEGLSVAFDLATHRGYDSDHPRVTGDVGKAGVAIDTLEDMKILFDGIPLDNVGLDDDERRGAAGAGLLHRRRRGAGRRQAQLSGTIQNDILKEFAVRNTYIYPPAPRCGSSRTSSPTRPATCRVQLDLDLGYHMLGGRGDGGQELAFTLADGMEYVRAAIAKGLDVDAFAPACSASSSASA